MLHTLISLKNPVKFFEILLFNRAMRRGWEKSFYYERFPHTLGEENGKRREKISLHNGERQ